MRKQGSGVRRVIRIRRLPEVDVDDWIEIGAFAKPGYGRSLGDTLYRERVHVTGPKATFTFTVDEKPHLVGVVSFSLLIDRNKSDNMRKPKAVGAADD